MDRFFLGGIVMDSCQFKIHNVKNQLERLNLPRTDAMPFSFFLFDNRLIIKVQCLCFTFNNVCKINGCFVNKLSLITNGIVRAMHESINDTNVITNKSDSNNLAK